MIKIIVNNDGEIQIVAIGYEGDMCIRDLDKLNEILKAVTVKTKPVNDIIVEKENIYE